MIIAFTGAQSSGKSTLLNKMREDEYFKDWNFEAEITRQLKEKYKLSINEDGDNFTQMITIHSHIDNYLKNKDTDCVLDRCCLDALVYTTYLSYNKKCDEELGYYSEYICKKLIEKYDIIFYTDPSIPLVDDGVRSVDVEFRNKVIQLFDFYIEHFNPKNVVKLAGTVEQRYKIIKKEIEKRKK
jgi:nicotinamide riboside kinase